jgi:DNA (cytosine-5)-methyltransferase 1
MSLRALDLYSGIGGWSLGLKAAGINVVGAFEISPDAVATYNANLGKRHEPVNVRTLNFQELPHDIDLVVGSPPCTEFSFSNRGGGGDLAEGLKDIVRFLEIVRFLQPKYWILENVPRTALVIESGLKTPGHPLYSFRALKPQVKIIDFSQFGLPQSRRRCVVGNFPFAILETYATLAKPRTLGEVISGLASTDTVIDPVWGGSLQRSALSEMEPEPPLDTEQLRMNREAKRFHPVYNDMSFPDRLDRQSRTVTATCTRVSRESIVIRDPNDQSLRRLTVRERASLQGFPITYQFLANSHSTKVKMIGNALPPLFSFFVGMASKEKTTKYTGAKLETVREAGLKLASVPVPKPTPPHNLLETFPKKRRFRAAVPGLRFKSGMRFELANEFINASAIWKVRFFFGPSKDIQTVLLNDQLLRSLRRRVVFRPIASELDTILSAIEVFVGSLSPEIVQQSWTRRSKDTGPYAIVDLIGLAANELSKSLALVDDSAIAEIVLKICGVQNAIDSQGTRKLGRHSKELISGFLVGSFFNQSICAGGSGYSHNSPSSAPNTCFLPKKTTPPEESLLVSSRSTPGEGQPQQISGGSS